MSVIQHSIGFGSATRGTIRNGGAVGTFVLIIVVLAIAAGVVWLVRQHRAGSARELDDARHWVERLGGADGDGHGPAARPAPAVGSATGRSRDGVP